MLNRRICRVVSARERAALSAYRSCTPPYGHFTNATRRRGSPVVNRTRNRRGGIGRSLIDHRLGRLTQALHGSQETAAEPFDVRRLQLVPRLEQRGDGEHDPGIERLASVVHAVAVSLLNAIVPIANAAGQTCAVAVVAHRSSLWSQTAGPRTAVNCLIFGLGSKTPALTIEYH